MAASVCEIHGAQDGLSCVECDQKADKKVLQAREISPSNPSGSDQDFDAAVAKAVARQMAAAGKGKKK